MREKTESRPHHLEFFVLSFTSNSIDRGGFSVVATGNFFIWNVLRRSSYCSRYVFDREILN